MKGQFYCSGGFSLIEILVALSIAGLLCVAIVRLAFSSVWFYEDSGLELEALMRAKSALDRARIVSYGRFEDVVSSEAVAGRFTEKIVVDDNEEYVTSVTSEVLWKSVSGRDQSVAMTSRVSDWEAARSGDWCVPLASSKWDDPYIVSASLAGISGTVTGIDVKNGFAYITSNSATRSDSDMYVVDVRNADNPRVVSEIDTGPGLMSIHVVGSYAYVASASRNEQFQIIDVSIPSNVVYLSGLKLPGVGGSGAQGIGNDVFYYREHAYVGLTKNDGPELFAVDVSDPAFPVFVDSFETGTKINDVYARLNRLYLATPTEFQIRVVDISKPESLASMYDVALPVHQIHDGEEIAIVANRAFVGRSAGSDKELYEVVLEDASGKVASSYDLGSSARGIKAVFPYLFVGTNSSTREFMVWNIDGTPRLVSHLNLSSSVTALDCDGSYVYAATVEHPLYIFSSE